MTSFTEYLLNNESNKNRKFDNPQKKRRRMVIHTDNDLPPEYKVKIDYSKTISAPTDLHIPMDHGLIAYEQLDDPDFILEKIKLGTTDAFLEASTRLLNDLDFIMKSVELAPELIYEISPKFRYNSSVVQQMVIKNPNLLSVVFDTVRHDRLFFKKLLSQCGMAIRHTDDAMKNDEELASIAVGNDGNAYVYLGDDMMCNEDIILRAVEDKLRILDYVPMSFPIYNGRFALNCISRNISTYYFYRDMYADDEDVTLFVVRKDGAFLQYASDRLQHDKKIIIEALKSNPSSYNCLPDMNLKYEDIEIIWLSSGRYEIVRNMNQCHDMRFHYK